MRTRSVSAWMFAFLVAAGGGGALAARAGAEDEAPPAAPPNESPSQEQIQAWVAQLGSDEFRLREEASQKLQQAGEPARAAVEQAMKTSDSLEVRWRAQQILLRLDGRQERHLGAKEPKPGAQPVPPMPGAPGSMEELRKLLEADQPEVVKKLFEQMLEKQRSGPWGQGPWASLGGGSLGGLDLFGGTVRSGDLTLRQAPLFANGREGFGQGQVELEVRGKDGAGLPTSTTFRGASLEAILEANPALKDHPSLPGLKQELERWKERRRTFTPGMTMPLFTMTTGQGIEVQQDAQGATVRLRERGADGQMTTREFKGATLEDIKREHPEIADRLKGISLGFGAPQVFRGLRGERLPPPMPAPAPERAWPRDEEPRFGLRLDPVEGLLQRHLKLEQRGAVLVVQVLPGSQAEALGLQELDILLAIDGTPIASLEDARARLGAAAKSKAALKLDILRSGQPQVLTR
jgi:hypothetical protein